MKKNDILKLKKQKCGKSNEEINNTFSKKVFEKYNSTMSCLKEYLLIND
jgi:hypothetical protein